MDLGAPLATLLSQLLLAGGDDDEAPRLRPVLEASARMALLEVLGEAADEVNRQLADARIEVRLEGRSPRLVVVHAPPEPAPAPAEPDRGGLDGPVTRVNFRPPEQLKQRLDAAAAQDGVSVNAWLVSAVDAALSGRRRHRAPNTDNHQRGWVG